MIVTVQGESLEEFCGVRSRRAHRFIPERPVPGSLTHPSPPSRNKRADNSQQVVYVDKVLLYQVLNEHLSIIKQVLKHS